MYDRALMARAKKPPRDESRWSESGFVRLGRWRGAPLLFHWTIPLGLYLLGRMQVLPGFWLAGTALIVAHELGHAALAMRYGARVVAVKVMPVGGLCVYEGDLTEVEHSKVAWGGVLVQLAVWAIVSLIVRLAGSPSHAWLAQSVSALTEANAFLIALNLMPVKPLDGYDAWRLPLRFIQSVMQRAETEKIKLQAQRMRARGPRVDAMVSVAPPEEPAPPAREATVASDDLPVTDEARELAKQMWSAARRDPTE